MHAAGAAFDNPDLTVACVIGDGEAETGPLSGSWRLPAFLNPRTDGGVLPILHLNGYKIAGPTVLGRSSDEDVTAYLRSQGWDPVVVSGDDPREVFPALYAALSDAHARIAARDVGTGWPAIILRTPKGWTGPDVVDGVQVQGTFRAHQVPLSGLADNPEHLRMLEEWMRSYSPETLFDESGRLVPELRALAPAGRPPHVGDAVRQRWPAPRGPPGAGPREVRGGDRGPRQLAGGQHGLVRRADAGPVRRHRHLPALLPRRDGEQPAAGGVRGDRPGLHGSGAGHRRPPRARTAA